MAKSKAQPDVVVVGSHPCCYFTATLLSQHGIATAHVKHPDDAVHDRLVLLNPEFFALDKLTGTLKRSLTLSPIYGLKFLSDDPAIKSEFSDRKIVGYVGSLRQIRAAMIEQAQEQKIDCWDARSFEIQSVDEGGLAIRVNNTTLRPKAMVLGCDLAQAHRKLLGLPDVWEGDVLHRYTYLKVKSNKYFQPGSVAMIPMSLDLCGQLIWAWLLPGPDALQIALAQPMKSVEKFPPTKLLARWIEVLIAHQVLKPNAKSLDAASATSVDLPLAGALAQEGVANRTLLVGPAGGFYTACAEDIYPNCWSAMFAVEVLRKALLDRHLQDSIGAYRQQWGSTLGDYLRGPQQNLRFLLPLVYRNPVMTARISQAILSGTSVVR